jgi:hypothetical protein
MALSTKARKRLEVAMARRAEAKEVADAIDAGGNSPAATVAAITTANATDLPTAQALANQLKTTVNDILTALKAAGLMS